MYKIRILLYEMEERFQSPEAELQLALRQAGFDAEFAAKSQQDLDLDPGRVADFVRQIPCDAWIVFAGSNEILKWFSQQGYPTLGIFGIFTNLTIAGVGPSHLEALKKCIHELARLGHQRISMFSRKERRKPTPGPAENIFINALEKKELPVTEHTLPDWKESLSGFRACLESLFRCPSPPTAIIFQEPELVMAALQFFAQHGIEIPDHVSMFCTGYDPRFEWSVPCIAHSHWEYKDVVDRALNWAQRVSCGGVDKEIEIMKGKFVAGGTIAPPPSNKWVQAQTGKVW
jgi:DNA-binding LacI/PurR family transcriptional regulator